MILNPSARKSRDSDEGGRARGSRAQGIFEQEVEAVLDADLGSGPEAGLDAPDEGSERSM